MQHFSDLLMEACVKKKSVLIVGLDPYVENLPKQLFSNSMNNKEESIVNAIHEFNKIIIDAVHPFVVGVKPQLAFYEMYGSLGLKALEMTIKYAKTKDLIIINDAKRGDIGSTAAAYAEAFLGNSPISGDAVTVNPFLGRDGIQPFIQHGMKNSRGLFVLLKTSNPSSGEIQDLVVNNENPLYMNVASLIKELSEGNIGKYGFSSVGAVVGATYPEVSIVIRKYLPNTIFLVPGFGEQGGSLENLKGFFDSNGNGALISSSRGIIYSYIKDFPDTWRDLSTDDIKNHVEKITMEVRDKINTIRFSEEKS
ncbi:orotidine-5'-phosphate decarboxylase [Metabacillus idriensis]|uniref:orotidine-5'-phosphate decarboxylase n=1 Tax=Metabacillus idriensis TaxID=324768 RepID=UPI0017493000|nr:orotidine-5'-phosphate decarboxylase [Metabacillus idriensis]